MTLPEGLLDTSVFIHAQTRDAHSSECRRFLKALEDGRVHAHLEAVVLHELSYALRHYRKEMTRAEIAEYLLTVLGWDGVYGEKALLVDAVERWRDTPDLAFVDACLAAQGAREGRPIYTKNIRELQAQGASVPDPLPA